MGTLLLVRHGTTAETRDGRLPTTSGAAPTPDCPALDRYGQAQARALAGSLPSADRYWSSLARRTQQTAELATGHTPDSIADLAECDFGRWAGMTPDSIHAREPDALASWYADQGSAPHGGERLADVRARATAVMHGAAAQGGTTIAVTHGGLIRAALLEVLELPDAGLWRLEASPGSVTSLRYGHGSWRVERTNWTPTLDLASQDPA